MSNQVHEFESLTFFISMEFMWQSCVEIEGYSVVYFDRITAFEALYRWTSVKGGAHMHFVVLSLSW